MTAFDLLIDFAIMSLLLVVAQFLRAHIKPIQKLLLPSSVVAGLIGLVLGPQCLNLLPLSSHASSYSGVLIVILFSSLFIGIESMGSFKQTMPCTSASMPLHCCWAARLWQPSSRR